MNIEISVQQKKLRIKAVFHSVYFPLAIDFPPTLFQLRMLNFRGIQI